MVGGRGARARSFPALHISLDLRESPFDPAGERPHHYTDSSWKFLFYARPGHHTRLVVSGWGYGAVTLGAHMTTKCASTSG